MAPGIAYSKEELLKMSRERLNEDPRNLESDLKSIRDWIKQQPHLDKYVRQDDDFILFFLRGSKFSLERTKEKIENWNTFRGLCPEVFSNWDVNDAKNKAIVESGFMTPLPGYDKEGRKVFVMRAYLVDPDKYTMEDMMRVHMLQMETIFREPDLQMIVCGFALIQDSSGSSMRHMKRFNPALGKKMATIFQEAFPIRPQAMHMVNIPSFAETILNVMRGFLKPKMRERLRVHPKGDYSGLIESCGKEVLPEEFGGTNGKLSDHVDEMKKRVFANRDWILRQEKMRSNEKKRKSGMKRNYSDVFGMEGSFRQLAFD